MKAFFVTATGTEIGKTLVTCALAWQLRQKGKRVKVLKPVISGYDPESPGNSDPHLILRALGEAASAAAIDAISPWRFAAPLAPDQAAALEGRSIDFDALVGFCRDAMNSGEDYLLVEGLGGAFVPLAGDKTVADWIAALDFRSIIVTGNYLGTLSHTISVLEAMRNRNLDIASVIINDYANSPLSAEENASALRPFVGHAKLLHLPKLECSDQPWRYAPGSMIDAVM